MAPATATAAPTPSAVPPTTINRTRLRSTPSEAAASSPSVKCAEGARRKKAAKIQLATMNGAADQEMIARAILQRTQQPERNLKRDEGIGREIEDERGGSTGKAGQRKAGQQDDRETGALSRDQHQRADRCECAEDADDRHDQRCADDKPKAMTKDEAAAAACGAPNTAGSASGLRNSPCKAAPDKAERRADQSGQQCAGSRISRTMMAAGPSPLQRAASAVRAGSPAGPTISDTSIRTRTSATAPH